MFATLGHGSLAGRLGLSWYASVLPLTGQCSEVKRNADNSVSVVELHMLLSHICIVDKSDWFSVLAGSSDCVVLVVPIAGTLGDSPGFALLPTNNTSTAVSVVARMVMYTLFLLMPLD